MTTNNIFLSSPDSVLKSKQTTKNIFEKKYIMSELHCICTYATDGQWLFLIIIFWFGMVVFVGYFVLLIYWDIQDGLERRRYIRRQVIQSPRTAHEEERFEEIHE